MLYYALVFLILGVVASVLGAYGVAAVASQIAWVLFVIGIVLMIVHVISGRRTLLPLIDVADDIFAFNQFLSLRLNVGRGLAVHMDLTVQPRQSGAAALCRMWSTVYY